MNSTGLWHESQQMAEHHHIAHQIGRATDLATIPKPRELLASQQCEMVTVECASSDATSAVRAPGRGHGPHETVGGSASGQSGAVTQASCQLASHI